MAKGFEIEVPSSLDSVNLKQYQSFQRIIDSMGDEIDEVFLKKHMISIFCNIPMKELDKIPFNSFDEAVGILSETFNQNIDNLVKTFVIGDVEYGFEPNLDMVSTAVYMDSESSMEWEDYHIAMAALYRPIAFKKETKSIVQYTLVDYKPTIEQTELMKYAPLDAVLTSRVFFCNLSRDLQQTSLIYLERIATKEISQKEKEDLKTKMDGIIQYMSLQEESLRTLMKSSVSQYIAL